MCRCGAVFSQRPVQVIELERVTLSKILLAGVTDVLVDQDNADILPLLSEALERRLDGRRLRLAVDDQEVLLGVGAGRDMLDELVSQALHAVLPGRYSHQCLRGAIPSPNPTLRQRTWEADFSCRRDAWGTANPHLVADDGQKLAVLEIGLGGHLRVCRGGG